MSSESSYEDVLSKIKEYLISKSPLFAVYYSFHKGFNVREDLESIASISADGLISVRKDFFHKTLREQVFIIAHEIMHYILRHHALMRILVDNPWEAGLFNIVADTKVNQFLINEVFSGVELDNEVMRMLIKSSWTPENLAREICAITSCNNHEEKKLKTYVERASTSDLFSMLAMKLDKNVLMKLINMTGKYARELTGDLSRGQEEMERKRPGSGDGGIRKRLREIGSKCSSRKTLRVSSSGVEVVFTDTLYSGVDEDLRKHARLLSSKLEDIEQSYYKIIRSQNKWIRSGFFENILKSIGILPGFVEREIGSIEVYLRVNWLKILRNQLIRTMSSLHREKTWRKINKRFPYLHPGYRFLGLGDFIALVDTSGSISKTDAEIMKALLYDVYVQLRKYGIGALRVIEWDVRVTMDKKMRGIDLEKLRLRGGGGTILAPALKYVSNNVRRASAVVVVSDMRIGDIETSLKVLNEVRRKTNLIVFVSTTRYIPGEIAELCERDKKYKYILAPLLVRTLRSIASEIQ